MPNIDIPLPDAVTEALKQPRCADIALPKPATLDITLPSGAVLKGINDFTKGIPDDCSLTFSLALQLGPFLGAFECIFRMLKLLKPLSDVVTGLSKVPPEPPGPELIKDMAEAVKDLAECFIAITPLGLCPFIASILCLIAKVLNCIVGQMETLVGVLGGITLDIAAASAAGNTELLAALECAQENANCSAAHAIKAIDPLVALLSLIEPFLGIVGVDPIEIPVLELSAGESAEEALESIQTVIDTLKGVVDVLELAAEVCGGCGDG